MPRGIGTLGGVNGTSGCLLPPGLRRTLGLIRVLPSGVHLGGAAPAPSWLRQARKRPPKLVRAACEMGHPYGFGRARQRRGKASPKVLQIAPPACRPRRCFGAARNAVLPEKWPQMTGFFGQSLQGLRTIPAESTRPEVRLERARSGGGFPPGGGCPPAMSRECAEIRVPCHCPLACRSRGSGGRGAASAARDSSRDPAGTHGRLDFKPECLIFKTCFAAYVLD